MIKKIIIGTAQFGFDYGIKNKVGKIDKENIIKILKLAQKKKILYLDTSKEYGDSEKRISFYNKPNWKIITKISIKKIYKKNEKEIMYFFLRQIKDSKKKMNINNVYALLLHNADYLTKKGGEKFYKVLRNLKKNGFIKKFGYSIYSFRNLKKICKRFKPDIIQCPFNVFDRRLLKKENLDYLKKKKIEVHVRSVFLQGLLLEENTLPRKFSRWNKLMKKWDNWINYTRLSRLEGCLNFVNNVKGVDRVLIGVDNFKQFQEITNIKYKNKLKFPKYLQSKDQKLINPNLW